MSAKAQAKVNGQLAIAASFLANLSFILPIWLLYSINELEFSPTLATVLFMSIWVGSAFFEVPTGALADRLGRKKIFIIGGLLLSLYPLAYAFGLPLFLFFAVCLISAFGHAMQSGALLPIVHNLYNKAGYSQKQYNDFLSNNQVAVFVARVLSGISGAALYAIDPRLPFLALAGITLASVGLGFFVKNDEVSEAANNTNLEHIKKTLSIMKKQEIVVALFVSFITINLVADAIWTGYQVFFEADGRSAVVIGAIFSIIAIFSAIGAYVVRHAPTIHPLRLMQLFGLGTLLTATLLTQPNLTLRLFAIIPMGIASGITMVTLRSTVQHSIDNIFHSTALSVISFIQYVTYAAGSLVVAVLLQLFGVPTARVVLLIFALIGFISISLWLTSKNKLASYSLKTE